MTRSFVVVFVLLLSGTVFADDWLMPGLTAQWIAKDMTMNGVPASIREVRGQRPLDEVLTYYRRHWAGRIDERRDGDWHTLATMHGDRFASLRLRDTGSGVHGTLTVSLDPALAAADLSTRVPIPPGLTRLASQTFEDRGSSGENLTLMSPRDIAYERQAFASLYSGDGWTRTEDRAMRSVTEGHVLQFLHGKDQVRVVLYRDPALARGRTLILVSAHRD